MSDMPEIGKISPEIFSELIFPRLGAKSKDILVGPQRTVFAVIRADVGNQSFEEYALAAAGQGYGINPFALRAARPVFIFACATGACQIILGVGAENFEFPLRVRPAD